MSIGILWVPIEQQSVRLDKLYISKQLNLFDVLFRKYVSLNGLWNANECVKLRCVLTTKWKSVVLFSISATPFDLLL